jgi:hypothetical protein
MISDTGTSQACFTSYEPGPISASLLAGLGSAAAWHDLPSHQSLWIAADCWWNQGRPRGILPVEGGIGCGKSHWLRELQHRLKGFRTRMAVAEFAAGERVSAQTILQKWANSLSPHVEPCKGMPWDVWLPLALETLVTDGYQPVLAVEADDELPAGLPGDGFIHLRRHGFDQYAGQGLVLRPWSNDELGQVVQRRWPALVWPDETVELLWLQTIGQPRLSIELGRRLAHLAETMQLSFVEASWVGKISLTSGFTENWAGHSERI